MLEILPHITAADIAGLSGVSIFAALFFATFVSEDLACVAAGALAASGEISLGVAIASCFLGILAGDLLLYWVGRVFGRGLMRTRIASRFVSRTSLNRASAWLDERGASAVFISRFVTGLRLPTYLAAGFLRTDFRKFALYFILAAAIWTPLLVASVAFSNRLFDGRIVVAAMGVVIIARVAMKLTSWRSRRIFVGKLQRIMHWEFWPLGVFYFPVVLYILLLALRHRSLTVFTCANPGIAAGGFVGESKDGIYALLAAAPENREFLLPHKLIGREISQRERVNAAIEFMDANDLDFPVVVKPDAGERGKGVAIVRSHAELEAALMRSNHNQIVQQFFNGGEVSVFYHRHPSADRGEIFSITEKQFPSVTGDGESTVEELILRDARAVCLAEEYFEENADRLDLIPEKGEVIQIIDVGTHSRGAIFLDGEHFNTSELKAVIDAICRRTEGFHFGRFDIRYGSADAFRKGEDFKIIELNGVTSESTNIYDPRYSLFDAYRILFAQWRIAFEIGTENRTRGVRSSSVKDLCRAVFVANSSSFA